MDGPDFPIIADLTAKRLPVLCERCGNAVLGIRKDYDPPTAVRLVTSYCDICDEGGDFENVHYEDSKGKEFAWDDDSPGTLEPRCYKCGADIESPDSGMIAIDAEDDEEKLMCTPCVDAQGGHGFVYLTDPEGQDG